jgi:tRNA A-37 threonylcarbamoyl transferase component Bud32
VPHLVDIVVTTEDSGEREIEIGIIEDYIPYAEDYDMSNLGRIGDVAQISRQWREKWVCQIQQIISQLHEINVVWGDGKPHNMLIDSNTDDIWVVDFGGGYTPGWTDEATACPVEGDLQAMKRIVDFLEI